MKRKITKYIKFLFCTMIILSLTMPLYATAVDSNAFITKQEMDKAISDFNKRITTFKSGINSKIDLQISSYLDRNGIWSEQKQTSLAPDGWKWDFVNYTLKDGNGSVSYDMHNIFKSNKKGLCYLNFKYKINTTGSQENYQYTWGDLWNTRSSQTSFNVFDSTEVWYLIKDDSEIITTFNILGGSSKIGRVSDSNRGVFPVWAKVPDGTAYPVTILFFVENGATYGIQLVQYYYMDTYYLTSRVSTYLGQMEVYDFSASVY